MALKTLDILDLLPFEQVTRLNIKGFIRGGWEGSGLHTKFDDDDGCDIIDIIWNTYDFVLMEQGGQSQEDGRFKNTQFSEKELQIVGEAAEKLKIFILKYNRVKGYNC